MDLMNTICKKNTKKNNFSLNLKKVGQDLLAILFVLVELIFELTILNHKNVHP